MSEQRESRPKVVNDAKVPNDSHTDSAQRAPSLSGEERSAVTGSRHRRSLSAGALMFLTQIMLDDAWCSVTLHTFCAAHRDAYQALVLCKSACREGHVPRGAARFPIQLRPFGIQTVARTSRRGVILDHSTTRDEPVDAFVTHLRCIAAVFKRTDIAVRLVNLDSARTHELLRAWLTELEQPWPEAGDVPSTTFSSRTRVVGFVNQFCGRELSSFLCAPVAVAAADGTPARLPLTTLFTGTSEVELLGEHTGDAMLRGLEKLTALRHFTAARQRMVQTLKPLAGLTRLVSVNVEGTSICDADVKVLGALPALERLYMGACVLVTNLNPLGNSSTLQLVCANQCRQLLHVSALGDACASLSHLDLSDCPLISTAQLAALLSAPTQQLETINLGYQHLPSHVARRARSLSGCASLPVLSHVTHLYLGGSHLPPTVSWLEGAPHLQVAYLDESNVTEQHLVAASPGWHSLRLLSITNCRLLRTTLEFALELSDTLTIVHVSSRSLVPHHVVAALEQRCVFVQQAA